MAIEFYMSLAASAGTRVVTYGRLASQIRRIMHDLGEQEFDNARIALADAENSSDPRHELSIAIGHLQSAASNLDAAYQSELAPKASVFAIFGPQFWSAPLADRVWPTGLHAARVASKSRALIALIYAKLGDKKIANRKIEDFLATYDRGFHIFEEEEVREYLWGCASERTGPSRVLKAVREVEQVHKFLRSIGYVGQLPTPIMFELKDHYAKERYFHLASLSENQRGWLKDNSTLVINSYWSRNTFVRKEFPAR